MDSLFTSGTSDTNVSGVAANARASLNIVLLPPRLQLAPDSVFELLGTEDHKQTGPSMLDQENHQTYNGLLDGGVQQHTVWQIPQLADLRYRTCISLQL